MSIQSANSKVLKEMKRQYTAEAVESSLLEIRRRLPDSFVGMDVIAGFPGETDEEFLDSYQRLERLPWTRLHVFPYSERPGTFAARRKDLVDSPAIHKRAQMLRDLSRQRYEMSLRAQVGQIKNALALRSGKLITRDFWNVELEGGAPAVVNEELLVQIKGIQGENLLAIPKGL